MDGSEGLILSKIKEKDKCYIISHVESLKKKKKLRYREQIGVGGSGGSKVRNFQL